MTLYTAITSILALAAFCSAQLLTNGNSQFPSCAATCTLLNQAAQACGGTATADQAIWSCFCQSGYLASLYSSPSGICDAYCTNPTDNQQVMTWYTSNCGTDHGASEHADGGSNNGATTVVVTSTSASATYTTTPTGSAALPSTTASGGTVGSNPVDTSSGGTWWDTHYKWVIMLIVLFVGLILLALIFIWLKRRHDRKQDQIREGFNAGITTRSAPAGDTSQIDSTFMSQGNTSMMAAGALEGGSGSGRNSPARTREAFMPYGYGYTRSESRLSSRQNVPGLEGRKSPLARGATPIAEMEKEMGTPAGEGIMPAKRQKRVLVRERPASPEVEKI